MEIVDILRKARLLAHERQLETSANILVGFLNANPEQYGVLQHLVRKRLDLERIWKSSRRRAAFGTWGAYGAPEEPMVEASVNEEASLSGTEASEGVEELAFAIANDAENRQARTHYDEYAGLTTSRQTQSPEVAFDELEESEVAPITAKPKEWQENTPSLFSGDAYGLQAEQLEKKSPSTGLGKLKEFHQPEQEKKRKKKKKKNKETQGARTVWPNLRDAVKDVEEKEPPQDAVEGRAAGGSEPQATYNVVDSISPVNEEEEVVQVVDEWLGSLDDKSLDALASEDDSNDDEAVHHGHDVALDVVGADSDDDSDHEGGLDDESRLWITCRFWGQVADHRIQSWNPVGKSCRSMRTTMKRSP